MEASFAPHSVAVRGGLLESIAFAIFLCVLMLASHSATAAHIWALGIIVAVVWPTLIHVAHVSAEVLGHAVPGLDLLVVGGADGAVVDGVRLRAVEAALIDAAVLGAVWHAGVVYFVYVIYLVYLIQLLRL